MITLRFFGILILSFILYWVVPKQRIRNWVLILGSITFLYMTDKWSVVVVLGLTGFSYLFGNRISRLRKQSLFHFLGVSGVLAVLIVFKYLDSRITNSLFVYRRTAKLIAKLIMPLGTST